MTVCYRCYVQTLQMMLSSCHARCCDSHLAWIAAPIQAESLPPWDTMQTKVSKPQDAMMMTEPPPSQDAGGSTSQWEVFDAYKAHQDRSKAAEDQAKAKSAVATRQPGELASAQDAVKDFIPSTALPDCLGPRGFFHSQSAFGEEHVCAGNLDARVLLNR